MKKHLTILAILAGLIILTLFTNRAEAQSMARENAKLQKELSFANYQATWMDKEIDQAKAAKKQANEKSQNKKALDRHRNRVARLKD